MKRLTLIVAAMALIAATCGDSAEDATPSSVESTGASVTEATSTTTTKPALLDEDASVEPIGGPEPVRLYEGTAGPAQLFVLDDHDRPVVLFSADREGPHEKAVPDEMSIRLARCLDPECTEVVETVLITSAEWLEPVGLAATSDGKPIVTYFGVSFDEERGPDGPPTEATGLIFCVDEVCSDTISVSREGMRLRLRSDGLPVLVHEPEQRPQVISCLDPQCEQSEESPSLGDGDGSLIAFELTNDDLPIMARRLWAEGPGKIEIIRCEIRNCGEWSSTVVDMSELASEGEGQSVVTFDNDADPVIAMVGAMVGVATCGEGGCDDMVYNQIGHAQGGDGDGLTLTDDGRPVIAYRASDANGEQWMIKVAVCDDPACSSGTVAQITDHGTISQAVEIDRAGNPVISYIQWSAGTTSVYRCADPRCEIGALGFETFDTSDDLGSRPPLGPPAEGWEKVRVDVPDGWLMEVLGGENVVAYGLSPCGEAGEAEFEEMPQQCPFIGSSRDGLEWQWYRSDQASHPGPLIRIDNDTYVIGGQECRGEGDDMLCVPTVSTIRDGSWTFVDVPCDGCGGSIDTLVSWSGGALAFAVTNDGGGMWVSEDGFDWTRVEIDIDAVFGETGRPRDFIEVSDQLGAYGVACTVVDDFELCDSGLWLSDDGTTWTEDDRLTGLDGFEGVGLVPTPDGILSNGFVCTAPWECSDAVMFSEDGLAWRNVTPSDVPGPLQNLASIGDKVIAIGEYHDEYWGESVSFVAETSNLEDWTYFEIPEEFGRFGVNDLVAHNNLTVAVGVDDDGPAIWTRPIELP
jgi:hypothetical protein